MKSVTAYTPKNYSQQRIRYWYGRRSSFQAWKLEKFRTSCSPLLITQDALANVPYFWSVRDIGVSFHIFPSRGRNISTVKKTVFLGKITHFLEILERTTDLVVPLPFDSLILEQYYVAFILIWIVSTLCFKMLLMFFVFCCVSGEYAVHLNRLRYTWRTCVIFSILRDCEIILQTFQRKGKGCNNQIRRCAVQNVVNAE